MNRYSILNIVEALPNNRMNFEELLYHADMTKAELGRELGRTRNLISMWQDKPPRYAIAYLELKIKFRKFANAV